jgi:uncharacterized protein YgbK (DUF1537 family)
MGAEAVTGRLEELRDAGVAYALADAVEDDDLRVLADAAAKLPLLVGGAGLALGLAAAYRREGLVAGAAPAVQAPRVNGPAVVLAGSCSAVTREQVARMAAERPAVKVDVLAANGSAAEGLAADVLARLGDAPVLVYTTSEPDEVARVQERLGVEGAAARVEALLGEVARRAVEAGARRVVVAGGETAGAVLQALGVRALAVGPEIAPGVPWMTSLGEPRLALALKSGNFGGPDFFREALEAAA